MINESRNTLFDKLFQVISICDASDKCLATAALIDDLEQGKLQIDYRSEPLPIPNPGLPPRLQLVAPRKLKKRGISSQQGRTILMHAIAHIEFNAINLALDAAYRFRNLPDSYYRDWIGVAADEARHFDLIRQYLNHRQCDYGDFPAHSGLWDMAVHTQSDVVARMALIPRVLEARGLDVTPSMIERLRNAGDNYAVEILQSIYTDEIEHVKIGSKWFRFLCEQRNLQPQSTFITLVDTYLHGDLKGPFNSAARLQAGFDESEMEYLNNL